MTTADGTRGAPANDDVAALQRQLVDLVAKLDAAIDDAPTATAVHELNVQIAAVNARVTSLGRRLFAERTTDLSTAARDVADAIPKVERSLADLARLDAFVTGVTGVLALADKAIGLARTAAV